MGASLVVARDDVCCSKLLLLLLLTCVANGGGGECLTCLCLPFEGNGGGNDDTGSCPVLQI